jgi:hypothetical protein
MGAPESEVLMPVSDANDLDDVIRELGIEDSDTTPVEAVQLLKAELEQLHASLTEIISKAESGEWTLPSSFANCARTALCDRVQIIDQKSTQVGPVTVTTTFGRIKPD